MRSISGRLLWLIRGDDDVGNRRKRDRIADVLFQREAETGPLPFHTVDIDLFLKLIHDLLCDRKSQTGTAVLA